MQRWKNKDKQGADLTEAVLRDENGLPAAKKKRDLVIKG